MKIPGIGLELKRSKAKQAREITSALEEADPAALAAAIERKQAELTQIDDYIAKAQTRRKKVAADLKALETMLKARTSGEPEEKESESE
ncbi:MAG: hypothetical protein JRM82_03800 [Nitrososphaerota archaeon]|nr:hypothetical protein [Nitrososphaerota archaeon]